MSLSFASLRCACAALVAAATLLCALIAQSAFAQVVTAQPAQAQSVATSSTLQRVDAGRGDLDSIQSSLFHLQTGLREDNNFERVYLDPFSEGRLIRQAGGITASFTHSEYVNNRGRAFPRIPAGTEFFIGPRQLHQQFYQGSPEPNRFFGGARTRLAGALAESASNRQSSRVSEQISGRQQLVEARFMQAQQMPRLSVMRSPNAANRSRDRSEAHAAGDAADRAVTRPVVVLPAEGSGAGTMSDPEYRRARLFAIRNARGGA